MAWDVYGVGVVVVGGVIKSTLGMIQFSSSDSTLVNRGHMGAKHILPI